nr:CotH kinase family protein [Vallitaleaceae bacterium]
MKFENALKSLAILVVLAIAILLSTSYINSWTMKNPEITTVVDEVVFPHDDIIKVSIDIDEEEYTLLNENAEMETYVTADITYNGYSFSDIAIRAKGNSSLKSVASTDSDRYSFKVDFNYYIDDQSFFGITKLNLNNIFGDASYMREYIAYEALESLDSVASRTTYVELSVNDVYFGLYLAVEDVNDDFLYDYYGSNDDELY